MKNEEEGKGRDANANAELQDHRQNVSGVKDQLCFGFVAAAKELYWIR